MTPARCYVAAGFLLVALLLAAVWEGAFAQEKGKGQPAAAKIVWEYKVTDNIFEADCNQLGRDGWELVAVTSAKAGENSHAYFKRPKAESAK